MRVIWAYHHKDMGEAGKNYHGANRGTKSLRLLNPEREEVSSASLPYFDLTNKDVSYSMLWVSVEVGMRWCPKPWAATVGSVTFMYRLNIRKKFYTSL